MAVYPKPGTTRFMGSVGAGLNRERKSFKTESEAVAWVAAEEAKREASSALPVAPKEPTCWTLQKAFDQTVRHRWGGPTAKEKALINAKQALAFFGQDTPVNDITSSWVLEWMEELQDDNENVASTCNKKLSALSVMLKQSEGVGGLINMPKLKRYKEGRHRIVWFSDTEEKVMLETALKLNFPVLHDLIVFGMYTGFRRSELLKLNTGNYFNGNLILHAGETKTGTARTVGVSPQMLEIINTRRAAGETDIFPGMTEATLRFQWETLRNHLQRENDPKFIVHTMRHTCATRMVANGVPLNVVMAWMGHATIITTMRYTHVMDDAIKAAEAKMNARVPDLLAA